MIAIDRLPLARAIGIALSLQERMAPHCEKLEIAGSIRRGRPSVGDIDFVCIPRDKAALKARFAEHWRVVTDGEQNFICARELTDGFELQVDIFFARPATRDLLENYPSNWGSLLLCRTGSKEHNIYLVEYAKRMGLKWNPYQGVFDGSKLLASETEADIFKALDLEFVPPERREK